MEKDEKTAKYTLWESALILCGVPFVVAALVGAAVPLMLAMAWMRETVWNWYAPRFGLPHVGLWAMLVAGLFLSTFNGSAELKKEFYEHGTFKRTLYAFAGHAVTFVLVALVHWWRG